MGNKELALEILMAEDKKYLKENIENIAGDFVFENGEFESGAGLKIFDYINWELDTYLQGSMLKDYLQELLEKHFKINLLKRKDWGYIDMWVNHVSIDGVTCITVDRNGLNNDSLDVVILSNEDHEFHIMRKNIIEIIGTFYTEEHEEIIAEADITNEILSL